MSKTVNTTCICGMGTLFINMLKQLLGKPGLRVMIVFASVEAMIFSTPAAPIPVQSFHRDTDGVTLVMSPGTMKLTVCSHSIVRVMYSPVAALPAGQDFVVTNHSWKKASFSVADARGELTLTTAKLKVAVDKATGAVAFYDGPGHLLLAEPAAGGKTMTAATVNGESSFQPEQTFTSPADEFIYGLGQFQEGIWNWRGMPQQLRQLNTQISIPMILSSRGYGLLWNNAALTEFNPADTQVLLTNQSGVFTTTDAGEYVFFVKDGDRRGLIGVQVNGQTVAAITNMWVPYTISGKTALPANATCSVTLLGRQERKSFRAAAGQYDHIPFRSRRRD